MRPTPRGQTATAIGAAASASKLFGERWCQERRSAILLVPSVVARLDRNVLINPANPEFALIEASLHEPVYWDRRLFGV